MKSDALDTDLVILIYFWVRLVGLIVDFLSQSVDAVSLLSFVTLYQNDLLQATWAFNTALAVIF